VHSIWGTLCTPLHVVCVIDPLLVMMCDEQNRTYMPLLGHSNSFYDRLQTQLSGRLLTTYGSVKGLTHKEYPWRLLYQELRHIPARSPTSLNQSKCIRCSPATTSTEAQGNPCCICPVERNKYVHTAEQTKLLLSPHCSHSGETLECLCMNECHLEGMSCCTTLLPARTLSCWPAGHCASSTKTDPNA
jgi:hypothetical protein